MNYRLLLGIVLTAMTLAGCQTSRHASGVAASAGNRDLPGKEDADGFVRDFSPPRENLSSSGRSRYFVLEPGFGHVYEGKEDGKLVRLVISVLAETRTIDGVETRVVEERESADGQLVEVSRNYFAIDSKTGDVYYFGEDVDMYKNGQITGHGGSWHSGENGAKFGLALPGNPVVGQRYYQESAPEVALDRAEVVSVTLTQSTPLREFTGVVQTRETTPLEPGSREYKFYAPGVGLIGDGELKLVRYGVAPVTP